MGFSPGSFMIKVKGKELKVHWELMDGGRVILWRFDELEQLFEFASHHDAGQACRQLDMLVDMS